MASAIYKPTQGYWTRMMTAVSVGAIVAAGIAWLWDKLSVIQSNYTYYIQGGVALGIALATIIFLRWFYRSPKIGDFMIATEAEMRKVSWPDRHEIVISTWVVVVGTFMMALLLLAVDVIFTKFFIWIKVLAAS